MPTTLQPTTAGFITATRATVFRSNDLTGDWHEVPYLYLDSLRQSAAPEVDECQLTYHFGVIIREDRTTPAVYGPLDFLGQYVRVQIENPDEGEPIVWYGVIEADERDVYGSSSDEAATGVQHFTAFGLLRLLERERVRTSTIARVDDDPLTIAHGLPFNVQESGIIADRGNRSAERVGDVYLFADARRSDDKWTARTAAEYLLAQHPPRNAEGDPIALCRLDAPDESIDWYDITVRTDERTVKEILDELINRRRGVGYAVDFVEDEIVIRVFSFNDEPIVLTPANEDEDEEQISANPSLLTLDFESAVDVEKAIVRNLAVSSYDRVVASGDFETSTATFQFTAATDDRVQLVPDWTTEEERQYKVAASDAADYAALELQQKRERNRVYRTGDKVRGVYSRFRIAPEWQGAVNGWRDAFERYWVAPLRDAQGNPQQPWKRGTAAGVLWNRGLAILPYLMLREGLDYSGENIAKNDIRPTVPEDEEEPERPNLPPIVYVGIDFDEEGVAAEYQLIDQLRAGAADAEAVRRFSCHVRVRQRGPYLDIRVSGGPQHFIASSDFVDATEVTVGEYDEQEDPETNNGIDWFDMKATLSVRLPYRVTEEAQLPNANPREGAQERVLYLTVPDARLDYVVPQTVVQIDDGDEVISETGGFIRDDRRRLKRIARAAAEWYGRERQALMLSFKHVRTFPNHGPFRVGDLIVDIGANHTRQDVRTPITAVAYQFAGEVPMTHLETGYADLDLQ